MNLLYQFLHVSDLHLLDTDPLTGKIIAPVGIPAILLQRCFSGLWGHSNDALTSLDDFFRRYQKTAEAAGEPPPDLLVSGDLTATGSVRQFGMAGAYLGGDLIVDPSGRPVGLRYGAWSRLAIPGNHDQWGGANLPNHPAGAGCLRAFPRGRFPRIEQTTIDDPNGGDAYTLTILAIDTDADVPATSLLRLMARGAFQTQMKGFDTAAVPAVHTPVHRRLGKRRPRELRAMLLHHSLQYRGRTLEIDQYTRDALETFLVEHAISVLLCGHTHQPLLTPRQLHTKAGQREILEACCGTTTQDDDPPVSVRQLFNLPINRPRTAPGNPPPDALLLHKLTLQDPQTVRWEVSVYQLRMKGFRDREDNGTPFDRKYIDISVA